MVEHKTWFKSLEDTIEGINVMAGNNEYSEKEFLLTACYHYLSEYKKLIDKEKVEYNDVSVDEIIEKIESSKGYNIY